VLCAAKEDHAMITPEGLRVAGDLRVETLGDEVVVLDVGSGIVFRLEGAAARLVATLHAGGVLEDGDLGEEAVIAALLEAGILV
jgi:hypothetical protein